MINIENCCCFTGHRPERSPFEFDAGNEQYRKMVSRLLTAIAKKLEEGCTVFYTGMARGFDILAAEQVLAFRLKRPDIKLIAAVPFEGFERSWQDEWRDRFYNVLKCCDEAVTVCDTYHRGVYQQRNEYMVDRSRHVIAFFDGSKGGTGNTVKYAALHSREVLNIYDTDPIENERRSYKAFFRLIPPDNE